MVTPGRTAPAEQRTVPARWKHDTLELEVPTSRELTLAIIADTHSRPHPRALELVAAARPHRILHAGDIGDHAVLDTFATIAPVTAVRGNIDPLGLPDSVAVELGRGTARQGWLLLMHIAVAGPKLRADAARRAREHQASLVVCGHSHVPFIGRDRGLIVFNPGSIGPRRFQLPITFGVLRLGERGLSLHHVSCETGERWEPS